MYPGPYGPLNPPPPPSGPPPHAQQQSDADEHGRHVRHIHMQPGHERARELDERLAASPCYDAEDRGRRSSPVSGHHDATPEGRGYRERSYLRSQSLASPQESYGSGGSRPAFSSTSVRYGEERRYRSRQSFSPRGRSRSRSPRRHRHYNQSQIHPEQEPEQEHEYGGTRTEYPYLHRQRSLTPVPVRERRISGTDVPEAAYPLRAYTNYIADNHAAKRHHTVQNRHLPVFRNGDGKVNPSAYGSVLQYDFGLCYSTFRTVYMCEMGIRCPWRHHPLSAREKAWIEEVARGKGAYFIQETDKCWATPDVPVPGHNMIEVMQQERDDRRRR